MKLQKNGSFRACLTETCAILPCKADVVKHNDRKYLVFTLGSRDYESHLFLLFEIVFEFAKNLLLKKISINPIVKHRYYASLQFQAGI